MKLNQRLECLSWLGQYILQGSNELEDKIQESYIKNPWFTPGNTRTSLNSIAKNYLQENQLQQWLKNYEIKAVRKRQKIGLVLAGNIPLVGFHDVLCCFVSDHIAVVKLSDKDQILLPFLFQLMIEKYPEVASYIQFVDRLKGFDAIIATGSNNTSIHFEYYFRNYPNIIRKNRNSVAILYGDETEDDFMDLGHDVFSYFGLGCRNVSKLYVPKGSDMSMLLKTFMSFEEIIFHNKYGNNYDYSNALYLLNRETFLTNGSVLLKEDERIASRISCLHFEYYSNLEDLKIKLQEKESEIQCIVSNHDLADLKLVKFGSAQHPGLSDYSDGVDTLSFLLQLKK